MATPSNEAPRTLDDVLRLPRVTFLDRGLLPEEPGLYFVLFEANPVRLAYVGKADSFRARWTGHHRIPDFELLLALGIAVEIAWLSLSPEILATVEQAMIDLLRPPLNARATSRTRQLRIKTTPSPGLTTAPEIIQEFRHRRDHAVKALQGDELWEACNGEDGDLLTLWAYPDDAVLVSVHDTWSFRDTHPITPSRVPFPPAFAAEKSSWVRPAKEFHATSIERRQWLMEVAYQIDAWLTGVVEYHGAIVSTTTRRDVLTALSREKTVSMLYAESLP